MRYGQRQSIAEWQEQMAAEQQAAREEKERPVREAEAQLKQTAVKLGRIERQNILKVIAGEGQDGFLVEPALRNVTMPLDEANDLTATAAAAFVESCPSYYACPENHQTLMRYILNNGISIIGVDTFRRAYQRLTDYSLLAERPPEPKEPEAIPTVLEDENALPASYEPEYEIGFDPVTGLERKYTLREVANMTAEQYRRTMRLSTINKRGEPLR